LSDGRPVAKTFRDYINNTLSANDRSVAIGNIQVFGESNRDVLNISIPIGHSIFPEANFILLSIDLGKYQTKLLYYEVSVLIILAILIAYLSYLYANSIKNFQIYEDAFNKIDAVMYKSPIPYARLNESDKIKDVNPAFCKLLEYNPWDPHDMKELSARTFASLCADTSSLNTYKTVEENRKQSKEVNPYDLNIKTKSGKLKKLTIVSGEYPSSLKQSIPETFGLLLDRADPVHKEFIEEYESFDFKNGF
jgi:PAS domain-containing protein